MVLPRIGGIIAERHATRQRDLDEAERLKSETDKALRDYEKALADAKGKANGIAETNRNDLKAQIDAERARVEKAIAAKAAEAEQRISTGKANALSQVGAIASETAEHIISELTGLKVSREESLAAVAAHTASR